MLLRIIAPKPAQRIGQNRAAVFGIVALGAELELVVVSHELERGGHFLVRQWPVAVQVVEVLRAVLQENPYRLLFSFANQRWIDVASADVSETADRAEHFAKFIRPFPGDRPRADAAGTDAAK